MLKTLLLLSVIISSSAFASPEDHILSVKERLRISFWIEGIETQEQQKPQVKTVQLPEEIERALKKL